MCILSFVCGVMAAIAVECIALVTYSIVVYKRMGEKKNEETESTEQGAERVYGGSLSEHERMGDS